MKQQQYKVGIYVRLSKDDERAGESLSIENQKLILQKHVQEQGWREVEIYADDGFSGVNFERPSVKRLIDDAISGKINLVLCKDARVKPTTTLFYLFHKKRRRRLCILHKPLPLNPEVGNLPPNFNLLN